MADYYPSGNQGLGVSFLSSLYVFCRSLSSLFHLGNDGRETSQQLRAFTVSFMRSIVAVVDEFSSFLSFFKC